MAFEQHKKYGTQGGRKSKYPYPYVSIYNSQIYISSQTFKDYNLTKIGYVKLFFDIETLCVGMMFCSNRELGYKITKMKDNRWALSAGSLFKKYDIKQNQQGLEVISETLGDETIYTFKVELNPAFGEQGAMK